MAGFIDQVAVLLIVSGAIAYLVRFFWNTVRTTAPKPCGKAGGCKCGPAIEN